MNQIRHALAVIERRCVNAFYYIHIYKVISNSPEIQIKERTNAKKKYFTQKSHLKINILSIYIKLNVCLYVCLSVCLSVCVSRIEKNVGTSIQI